MRTYWMPPVVYRSKMEIEYASATALIDAFMDGEYEPPRILLDSIDCYLTQPDRSAELAVKSFEVAAAESCDEMSFSDEHISPKAQAIFAIALVLVWASKDTDTRLSKVLELVRHSWWLENLWCDVSVVVAKQQPAFHETVCRLAEEMLFGMDNELVQKYEGSTAGGVALTDIWFGHSRENRAHSGSWNWIKLLAELDKIRLIRALAQLKSIVTLQRVLESPVFYKRFDLWAELTIDAPFAFETSGAWNNSLLLPLLIKHGHAMLLHSGSMRDGAGTDSGQQSSEHLTDLLNDMIGVLKARNDYIGGFKRWGAWLTRQLLIFPSDSMNSVDAIGNYAILMAWANGLADFSDLENFTQNYEYWEPWVYRCMRALLVSSLSGSDIPVPETASFLNEWSLKPDDWFGDRGAQLRRHAQIFHSQKPNDYMARLLGYSVALAGSIDIRWLEMWNGSLTIREVLEYRPVVSNGNEDWCASDASSLMRVLVDLGLGILDCTAVEQAQPDVEELGQAGALFTALWEATTEMLCFDFYGADFWIAMQRHLAIRRVGWAASRIVLPGLPYGVLDERASPSVTGLFRDLASDPWKLAMILPMFEQNNISLEFIAGELKKAQVNIGFILHTVKKLQQLSDRRFNIGDVHVRLLEDISRLLVKKD